MNEMTINDPGSALLAFINTQPPITRLIGLNKEMRAYPQYIPQKMSETVYAITFQITSEYPTQHLKGVGGMSQSRLRLKHYAQDRTRAMFLANTIRSILLEQSGRRYWGPLFINGVMLEIGPFDNADPPRDGSDVHRPNLVCDYSVSWSQLTESM